jgi:hypothetical protein
MRSNFDTKQFTGNFEGMNPGMKRERIVKRTKMNYRKISGERIIASVHQVFCPFTTSTNYKNFMNVFDFVGQKIF